MFLEKWVIWVFAKLTWNPITLQETRSIHDYMNIPKIEFIS